MKKKAKRIRELEREISAMGVMHVALDNVVTALERKLLRASHRGYALAEKVAELEDRLRIGGAA